MEIDERKKKQNLAEYIIYLWRTEDLLRSYELNLEKIDSQMISFIEDTPEHKVDLKRWYGSLIEQMREEKVDKSGHLKVSHALVHELTKVHRTLLEDPIDTAYSDLYEMALPDIQNNLRLAAGKIENEVEICLNGVYGLMLLRLYDRPVNDEMMKMIDLFGSLLSYLSYRYRIGCTS